MQIRVATMQDAAAIRAVGVAAWHDTYPGIVPDNYIPYALAKWWAPEEIQRHIQSEQFIVLVAESDGQIMGIAHVQLRADQSAILWRLYVAQAFRGQGIGSALIGKMEQQLPVGTHTFYIDYFEKNRRAAELYAKLGFVFDRHETEIFEDVPIVSTFVKRAVQRSSIDR